MLKDLPVAALPRHVLIECASIVGVSNAHRQDRQTLANAIAQSGVVHVRMGGPKIIPLTHSKEEWAPPQEPDYS